MDLEQAWARQARRLDQKIFEPVAVNTVDDIKRVIAELHPERQVRSVPVTLSTVLSGQDEEGTIRQFQVSADTYSQTKRAILLEGFTAIRNQRDANAIAQIQSTPIMINGVEMRPAQIGHDGSIVSWIDALIDKWFAAKRRGMVMYWVINGYEYHYDIFTHKLTRVFLDAEDRSSTVG